MELKKVTWPTPKQTMASTAVVIILVFVISFILGIIDFALAKAVKLILG
jgi:preprotein translocase subunit SecE